MSHSKGVPAIASHLTLEEREVIAHMHRVGKPQTRIAERRRRERPWVAKMQRAEVRRYVGERLRQRWSPDQIAGRSRSDFPHDRRRQISPPTIYAWIRAEEARGKHWQRYLRRLGRKRPEWQKRGRQPALFRASPLETRRIDAVITRGTSASARTLPSPFGRRPCRRGRGFL